MPPVLLGILIVASALAYSGATVAMKHVALSPGPVWLGAVALLLAAAVVFEVLILRREHITTTYVTILGIEGLIILAAGFAMGEPLALRQLAGAVLVLGGAALVWA